MARGRARPVGGHARGILLAGDSYAGKSSIAAALHQQGAFWGGDDMVRIERADDGWLLHPSWTVQHLRDASGRRWAIAVRTQRLAKPVRVRTVFQLTSERSASSAEFRSLNETEHADVLLTDTSRTRAGCSGTPTGGTP